MKNKNLFTAILLLIFTSSFGQNSKHQITSGKIIFDITYPESKMEEKEKANLPKESVMQFKNDMSKVEVSMPMGKSIIITDNKSGEATLLMDMMGKKWAIKTNKDEIQKQKEGMKPKVEITHESKRIAGYSCTKAIIIVTTKKGDVTYDAWFTNDLKVKNSFSSQIAGIDGFLMEFNNNQNGMVMKMTARSVEAIDVPDSEFKIPGDYQVTTTEEMMKNMGGMK